LHIQYHEVNAINWMRDGKGLEEAKEEAPAT